MLLKAIKIPVYCKSNLKPMNSEMYVYEYCVIMSDLIF